MSPKAPDVKLRNEAQLGEWATYGAQPGAEKGKEAGGNRRHQACSWVPYISLKTHSLSFGTLGFGPFWWYRTSV